MLCLIQTHCKLATHRVVCLQLQAFTVAAHTAETQCSISAERDVTMQWKPVLAPATPQPATLKSPARAASARAALMMQIQVGVPSALTFTLQHMLS